MSVTSMASEPTSLSLSPSGREWVSKGCNAIKLLTENATRVMDAYCSISLNK